MERYRDEKGDHILTARHKQAWLEVKTGSFIKHQTEISQTAEFTKDFKRDFRYIKVVEDREKWNLARVGRIKGERTEKFRAKKENLEGNEVKSTNLRGSLEKSDGMSKEEIDRIDKDVEKHDDFLDAQHTLDSEYKRKQFLKDNVVYVPPEEIVLNPKEVKDKKAKDGVHYVHGGDKYYSRK